MDNVLRVNRYPHAISVPDGARSGSCKVLAFVPIIQTETDVTEIVSALLKRGFGEGAIW
jgi:hypothetical protein